jgi:hypothetical protein
MAACTPRCAMARCRPSDCGGCWLRTCRVGRRCSRWTRRCGRAATRSVPRVGDSTTTPRGTRRGSRSWRAGATSSSWAWSCSLTPGPRRWTCAALIRRTTTTWSRPGRSARCCPGFPSASRHRWWSSTAALTRCSCRWNWRARPSRCWYASAATGTSTPPAIPAAMGGRAARPATAPSCRWPTRPPGRRPRPLGRRPTRSTGRWP